MSVVPKSNVLYCIDFQLLSIGLVGIEIKPVAKGLYIVIELLQTLESLIPPLLNLRVLTPIEVSVHDRRLKKISVV